MNTRVKGGEVEGGSDALAALGAGTSGLGCGVCVCVCVCTVKLVQAGLNGGQIHTPVTPSPDTLFPYLCHHEPGVCTR